MSQINPDTLRQLREEKRWTLDDLARRSGINRQTIFRVESGKLSRNRKHTVEQLAKALQVEPEALGLPWRGEKKLTEGLWDRKSQLNLRVRDEARNALSLVAMRFKVSATAIVEIAPLLFHWAAERSLQRRRENLSELLRRQKEVSDLAIRFSHLHPMVADNVHAEDIVVAEQRSIDDRDLFGWSIDNSGYAERLPDDYQELEQNPMTAFLREIAAQLGDCVEVIGWLPDFSPEYSICKEDAEAFVGGDKEAAEKILSGDALICAMPSELHAPDRASDRARWVHNKADELRNERAELMEARMKEIKF